MKTRLTTIFWGLALIASGIVFLASNYHILPYWQNNPNFWIPALAALSALFLLTFVIEGPRHWGWLFPAFICAGQATTIYLAAVANIDDPIVAAPILFGAALPFFVGYLLDRTRTGLLIPGWIVAAVAGMMLFIDRVPEVFIPMYVLLAIAAPFLLIAFTNPRGRWGLIPGGILFLIAFIPYLDSSLSEAWIAPIILSMIALPFVVTALWSRRNWWAIIPAGILLSIGLALAVTLPANPDEPNAGLLVGTMFMGWALTFGVLWLLRNVTHTAWAAYPAVVLALMSAFAIALGAESLNIVWPVIIIAGGVFILLRAFVRPREV